MVAEIAIGLASLATSIVGAVASAVNRHADSLEKRKQFTQQTVAALSDKGYNAVIIAGGYKAMGHTIKTEHHFEGIDFTLFAAPEGQIMIVENRGDGGYENWALRGTNWVRWGNIVKFHTNYWNEHTMGKRFETTKDLVFISASQ
ncbi:hypothetical protein BCR34DRAFT_359421 [Clohesyomyces aquaticus]|uniref:Uncharacterized protein n=1 Tax=Clohesyomyces aquaticus TaxID=1231657 RepID=A0A1Y1ZIF2_9PLEO|nr:hypothetical protein BCR34DRAFT_359421 [Clohesyomyces aquaticus]